LLQNVIKKVLSQTTPKLSLNHKMGGVSIISGTLASASGAFLTFVVYSKYFIPKTFVIPVF
jgi:hypothetical protein